ncbi:MAG TPA: hypothetical protein VNO18_04360, partial [Xanthobacteraceae bacterium]|nr:hypothetical protein [Xanthobacteraceae bacterium]
MPDTALNLAQVLCDERRALDGKSIPSSEPNNPDSGIGELEKNFSTLNNSDLTKIYRRLNEDNRWALCLSGGGIRSAAFALGVVQC